MTTSSTSNNIFELNKEVADLRQRLKDFRENHKYLLDVRGRHLLHPDGKPRKRIYSIREFHEQLSECREIVRQQLAKIFGDETNTKEKGFIGDVMSYDSPPASPYQDGVLFAYLAADGGDTFKLDIDNKPGWRENFFYKGKRWSDLQLKNNFYYYFRILKYVVSRNHVPLTYWVEKAALAHLDRFQIISAKDMHGTKGKLYVPYYAGIENLDNCSHPDFCGPACPFKQLVAKIRQLHINTSAYNFNSNLTDTIRMGRMFDEAWEHMTKDKNHRESLRQWHASFEESGLRMGDFNNERRAVFDVVCLSQYHDVPYTIDIFLPEPKENKVDAWLVLTHECGRTFSPEVETALLDLSKALAELPEIERDIAQCYKSDLELFWKWEREYRKIIPLYERLAGIVRIMILALCEKNKIKIHLIDSRVKECASLFNKLVARANGRDNDPKHKKDAHLYERWVREGDIERALQKLLDVSGVRVICVFNEDVQHLAISIGEAAKAKHIKIKETRNYEGKEKLKVRTGFGLLHGYRSTHITIRLAGPRLKLPETEGLKGRHCEIQIRSILAHGWADIAHSVRYKSNLPPAVFHSTTEGQRIEEGLFDASRNLLKEDENFKEVRDAYIRLLMNYAD